MRDVREILRDDEKDEESQEISGSSHTDLDGIHMRTSGDCEGEERRDGEVRSWRAYCSGCILLQNISRTSLARC